ncbi:hypothetical protein [Paenibacillus sp. GCM10012303]|jgi:hypothetical protein|uniref:hypothetical protein n=1 Tax=Paenibacillus sp. GCM10012303 TaxID=3317340 RepID=UPI003614FB47
MDSLIGKLEIITEQLLGSLQFAKQEELEDFIEQRQALIKQLMELTITPDQASLHRNRVTALLEKDSIITARISEIQVENQSGITRMNLAKKQKATYEADYVMDPFMFDKKK